jgi:ribosomal protein S17E
MGKIKTRLVKRTVKEIIAGGVNYDSSFEKNKKILGKEMPSKRIKNQIAGFLSRKKKREQQERAQLEKTLKK